MLPEHDRALLRGLVRHARAAKRLRLEIPGLQRNELLARRIEQRAGRMKGVRQVRASALTGRVLILYDDDAPFLDELARIADKPTERAAAEPASAETGEPWHALSVEEALLRLGSSRGGLSPSVREDRLRTWGPNLVHTVPPRSRARVLMDQVANLPNALLIGSALLSLLLGDLFDAGAIAFVIGLNATVGYQIERKNERLINSWQTLEVQEVRVLIGGEPVQIPATQLVPGDVLLCGPGDLMPADARLIQADRLSANEAPLTGESEAQPKEVPPVDAGRPLAERTSMLYAGTGVATGQGLAVVTATGARTEMANVRALVEGARAPETPLERRLKQLGNQATAVSLSAAAVSGVAGLLHGRPALGILRNAVALGVAAIPEGLPLVSTAALVNAMSRMRARGMVIRRVASAETLGAVTIVCADKTGTLTQNRMQLCALDVDDARLALPDVQVQPDAPFDHPATLALLAGVLNSEVELHDDGDGLRLEGSSTEQALVEAARDAGLDPVTLRQTYRRRWLHERQNGHHYVVSGHDLPQGGCVAFIKGAPEQVIPLCQRDARGSLDDPRRATLLQRNEALANDGLRVLALGYRTFENDVDGGDLDRLRAPEYTFIGYVGLQDPLRDGAAAAVRDAARAGVRTVILTGDQRATAAAIGRQLGLEGAACDGPELAEALARGDRSALERLQHIAVVARVTPENKLDIVRALGRSGEVVAMAGDGINDAPALKAANVGIAVGRQSTSLARQTADVVLETEDLRAILDAMSEGRNARESLARAIRFLFATNLSEVALMLAGALIGREPMTPLQLLWINLLTDSVPALALALERGNDDVLGRPPARGEDDVFAGVTVRRLVRDALGMAALGGSGFLIGGPDTAFATITGTQLGYALMQSRAPLRAGQTAWGVALAAAFQVGALTLPPVRAALGLTAAPWLPLAGFTVGLVAPAVWRWVHAASPETPLLLTAWRSS